jgi:DNA-binding response OmpR family regulator
MALSDDCQDVVARSGACDKGASSPHAADVNSLSLCRKTLAHRLFWQDNRSMLQHATAPADTTVTLSGVKDSGTVLVVEDDPRMQKVLQRIFREEGYRVIAAGDGPSGLELFTAHAPVAVVLDLILPEMSGRDLCRELKALSIDTPVIILSAITEVVDKVLLLELGADDYVTKPFSPRELMARVQAAIRRRRKTVTPTETYRFGACTIDFSRMTALRGAEEVALTSLEFKLLRFFTANAERVLTREALLNDVWGYNSYPTTRTVDNLILKLRQKLEVDSANPRHLLTVHGAGYKFVP